MSKLITCENVSQAVFHWEVNNSFKHTEPPISRAAAKCNHISAKLHCTKLHFYASDRRQLQYFNVVYCGKKILVYKLFVHKEFKNKMDKEHKEEK